MGERNEFPWQAGLRRFQQNFCGGSVVNKDWVLTAAHCILFPNNQETIAIGEYERDVDGAYAVARQIPHASYSSTTLDHDIALIELSTSIDFSSGTVRPACIPKAPASEDIVNKLHGNKEEYNNNQNVNVDARPDNCIISGY